jgi:hypothetical protein
MLTRPRSHSIALIFRGLLPIAIGIGLMFIGCDQNPTDVEDYEPEPVLTAFLYNGEPVEEVYLERIAPLNVSYAPDRYFISGAEIMIFPVNDATDGDTVHFVEHYTPERGWMYVPVPNESLIPRGKVRYRIEARKPLENLYMWAETTVPDTFTLLVSPYTLEFDSIAIPLDWNDTPIRLDWTEADSAAGIVFSSVALEGYNGIPLDPDAEDPEDQGIQDIEILNLSATGIDIPWVNFYWVGWHWIQVQAVSADGTDYMMSLFTEQESNPIFNIHGGLGIFAGISRQSFYVRLQRVL